MTAGVVNRFQEKTMTKNGIQAAKTAGAAALAVLLTTSAFADSRPQQRTWRDGDRDDTRSERSDRSTRDDQRRNDQATSQRDRNDNTSRNNGTYRNEGRSQSSRTYRNNERVQTSGRISRYSHERGGYRVWVGGSPYAFWVPEARWRSGWGVGININIGGVYRDGTIYSDVYNDPYYNNGYGYSSDYVSGYVERIDYRTGTLDLRDDRSGQYIRIDMRSSDSRYNRLDFNDLRRGDRVTLLGSWVRNGIFVAQAIDSIDSGRY
jgi:hypothetical protein